MDDITLQDLKQFIAATVTQQVSDVRLDIKGLDDKLSSKIDNISNSVAEVMEVANDDIDSQLKDHEQRLTQLEHKIA